MKKTLNAIRRVWGRGHGHNGKYNAVWLIKKQVEEIENGSDVANELADILIIALSKLDQLGIDPEKLVLARLRNRHDGKVEEIKEKYASMWLQENLEKRRLTRAKHKKLEAEG